MKLPVFTEARKLLINIYTQMDQRNCNKVSILSLLQ